MDPNTGFSTPAYPSPIWKVFLSDAVHAAITGLASIYIVTSFVWNSRVLAGDRVVTVSVLTKNLHCLSWVETLQRVWLTIRNDML